MRRFEQRESERGGESACVCAACVTCEQRERERERESVLAAGKIGDSLIKSNMKLGPQTHLGAESQS